MKGKHECLILISFHLFIQAENILLRPRKAVFLARNVRRKKVGQPDVESEIKGIGPVAVPVPASEGAEAAESDKAAVDRKKKEKSWYALIENCYYLL